MTPKELVQRYVNLRMDLADKRARFKDEEAALKDEMEQIESQLKKSMNDLGVESLKTEFGTAYLKMTTHANTVDKASFFDYVRSTNNWELLDIRGSKTALEQFVEDNQVVPPGIELYREQTVGIRKS